MHRPRYLLLVTGVVSLLIVFASLALCLGCQRASAVWVVSLCILFAALTFGGVCWLMTVTLPPVFGTSADKCGHAMLAEYQPATSCVTRMGMFILSAVRLGSALCLLLLAVSLLTTSIVPATWTLITAGFGLQFLDGLLTSLLSTQRRFGHPALDFVLRLSLFADRHTMRWYVLGVTILFGLLFAARIAVG